MAIIDPFMAIIGLASLIIAAACGILTLVAVLVWHRQRTSPALQRLPPVSVLKPLCGSEPGLYENLRSFCQQDYPEYQIVFGVLDPHDPALGVVKRLVAEFPSLSIDVVINPQQHGSNCKVSNLINIIALARHDVLAMADSDACVGPDYLRIVTAPLQDRSVGLVTCLYRAAPTRLICSRLGAMYINEWYMPSVLLAWLFGYQGYASGQTLCIRHETLQAIGGLQATADHLADDHRLGELVRELGLRIVLSPYVLSAEHHEPSFASLTRHEVRWMRTIHVLRPRSFYFVFLTFTLPLALFGIVLAGGASLIATAAWALFCAVIGARLALHLAHRFHSNGRLLRDLWLLLGRDLLLFWVWYRSLFTSRVTWRGNEFDVDTAGVMHRLS
ncbi:MAG: bacteriohopanetetrol glucosamine biosynthesis glycosyltransferase HpnI [Chloroflexota bacterium]